MRPLGHGDLIVAARLLRTRPPAQRDWVLRRLCAEARAADIHVLAGRGMHPRWGDGSLMTAALRRGPLPDFGPTDADYCRCLSFVAAAAAKAAQPRAQATHNAAAGSSSSLAGAISSPHSWQ